ncbi:probable beta-lactamase [Cephalotrichum gorgonifer]|uniref:Probable beta-lactamase n=1 Tax=Cephalotrichum gorgonifer TaxID=2041049 RepID=A0AAE8SXD5_9PEZI|nr:probable beta-lactamase [Cephalotrichum gorgonifer]
MAEVKGTNDPAFQAIRDLFSSRLEQGDELGASLCINIDGKDVVDIWGGYADIEKTQPWNEDTLVTVWSCTKVVAAIAAAILIDRGLLDPEEKVAKYWPEFGTNGKEDVTVANILSHSSGVPAWEQPITLDVIYDTEEATKRLAQQAPWWTPGESSGYQMFNHGHLIGELVRRTTGKSLKQFIAEEIATPLGADFRLGLEEHDWPRAATLVPPPPFPREMLDPESLLLKTMAGAPVKAEDAATPGFRAADIGAGNGFGNARSLCRIGSVVSLEGVVDGKKYLSPRTIDNMLQERVSGEDVVIRLFLRFGLGVGLSTPQTVSWLPEGRACFWGGWGGSILLMDLDRRMTIGYAMNKMGMGTLGTPNTEAYVKEIYATLERLDSSSSL